MKKVCMLTSNHSPLDARIFYKEAMSLFNNGFSVSIIAPISVDGYFKDTAGNEIFRADSKLKYEYNNIMLHGFYIKKIPIPKLKFLHFMQVAASKLTAIGRNEEADVYHCHELPSLVAGVRIKKMMKALGKKVHLVYDVHEYWPGVYQQRYQWFPALGKLVKQYITILEKNLVKWCDFVISANQIERSHILLKNKSSRVVTLYNCPILKLFKDTQATEKIPGRILCHEGTLTFDRGLKIMIDIIITLRNHYNKIKLLIVGDVYGEERVWLKNKIEEHKLAKNIHITKWVPYEEVGKHVAKGDIGIILMRPTVNNMLAGPPNKLFNYMRYGLPVIAPDFPEMRRIIKENNCGLLVDPMNTKDVCKAVRYFFDNPDKIRQMGQKSKVAINKKYNWEIMEKHLLDVYKEMLSA